MDSSRKLEEIKKVVQSWLDRQSHDRCWYYPELFRELVKILDIKPSKEPNLPPLEEFKEGCRRYQAEEFNLKE